MHKRLLFSALLLISIPVFAQYKVRFIVQEATALKHDSIFIAGSFSNWSPNNSKDLLKRLDATHKTITLNLIAGTYQFSFTKGDWSKIEKNGACAGLHRILSINSDTTIHILIKNWSDDCSVNFFSGDKWYLLRNDSVSALSELVLSMVILIYLLSIGNKSKDGWLITRYMIILTILNLVNFLRNINETSWRFDIAQDVATGWVAIFHVWFSYNYRQKYFRKEKWIVLGLLTVFINTILLFEMVTPPVEISSSAIFGGLSSILFVAYLWSVAVLLRKAAKATYTSGNKQINSTVKDRRVFRSLAWWSGLFVVLYLITIMYALRIELNFDPIMVFYVVPLIYLPWFAIIYVNYAEEYTTFQVKLVGIMLCVTLMLLGLLAFIILPAGYISQTADGKPVQDAINTLALLVPLMTILIVLVFPLFFKKNLLRPLKDVLDGVQRVNAGDLNVEVPVDVKDEIGFLSHNFNQMTQSLRQYSENMETLVTERTTELEQKTTELEKQKGELQISLENLKAAQSQLIQSEKMASLGELTAGIAHEIQNPLNFVNNFSEVNTELIDELNGEVEKGNLPGIKSLAGDIRENEIKISHHGKRADAIVKSMLQHSRTGSGKKEPTNMNALTDEYLRLAYHGLRAKAPSFNATMKTEYDAAIGNISIIPNEIGRVLLNLYNNAFYSVNEKKRSFSGEYEPTVSVRTCKTGNKIEIRVKDNGNGIPAKLKDKIFQPFFTTKPTGQGTGLGLSLSYDIVKAHGGEIKLETKEGEFTEFIIQIPAI
jgi:signal transduction histidine kinase